MTELEEFRKEKDEFFATHPQSPLTRDQKQDFKGLQYFPENPDLRLEIELERFPSPETVQMLTTTNDVQTYLRYGRVPFTVDGQETALTVYAANGEYFLPFVDSQAGKETYGAGRYLEPQNIGGGKLQIDFNYAYNPYCAYNEPQSFATRAGREPRSWSCPVTPAENRLKVPIRAGEKMPEGDWVEHE